MARERRYWVDFEHKQLMQHSENGGIVFPRNGPDAAEKVVDINSLRDDEMREALHQIVGSYGYGSDGSGYIIHPDRLGQFILAHAQAFYCCHNAVFDFWTTAQHLADNPQALTAWWAIAGEGRLACTMLPDQLIEPYASELLPDAERRYGPLTVRLQVQGAIALEYLSRAGVAVDVLRAHALHEEIGSLVKQRMAEMEQLAAGVEIFKKYKRTGEYQLTKSGAAKRNAKAIKSRLEQAACGAEEPIRLPRVKNGSVSDAASFWQDYVDLDPFIAAYVHFYQRANLLKFCHELTQPRIYPKYNPLVHTGRTSCSDPNLQQLPRDARFREMIVAPPGYQLLQIDYSALELRTLAAICLRRYGRSRLAELLSAGVDPHKYTAALLLGVNLEPFAALPKADQKQHRQRAKAINFGVPGGLGAASLVSYAKHSYGVQLTFEEAQQPSLELARRVFWGSAVTLTGRLRGHVGYTQRANSPFQALAADGNKAALFRLLRAGFQVCGFIHDEMLILLPDGADYDAAVARVQQVLADAMQELTPGVPSATEFLLADRWYKSVDEQPRDATGRIVPYTAQPAADPAVPSRTTARSAKVTTHPPTS